MASWFAQPERLIIQSDYCVLGALLAAIIILVTLFSFSLALQLTKLSLFYSPSLSLDDIFFSLPLLQLSMIIISCAE